MKYLIILLVVAGAAWWWMERRRAVVRQRLRETEARRMTQLLPCPKCGVYAVEGQHSCG